MKKTLLLLTTIAILLGFFVPNNIVYADEGDLTVVLDEGFDFTQGQSQQEKTEEQRLAEEQERAARIAEEERLAKQRAEEQARKEAERQASGKQDDFSDLNITGIPKSYTTSSPVNTNTNNNQTNTNTNTNTEPKVDEVYFDVGKENNQSSNDDYDEYKQEANRLAEMKKAAEEKARLAEEERQAAKAAGLTGNNKTPDVTLQHAQLNIGKCRTSRDPSCGDIYDGKHGLYNFSGGGVDEEYDTSIIENLIFEKLNALRAEKGLMPLVRVDANSRAWAEVMATTGLFEHATMNVSKRGYASDYASRTITCSGENILINTTQIQYATYEDIAEAISNQWNKSEGHYANRTQSGVHYSFNDGDGDYLCYDIAVVRSASGYFWAVERFGGGLNNIKPENFKIGTIYQTAY